ncbi:GNAT family N-acetyltransferase [Gordonia sinesedis]
MFVETPRTLLRPVTDADVDELVALDSDPAVMRYVSGGAPTPRDVIVDWVLPRAVAEHRTRRGGLWTITDRRYGRFLGWMSLRSPRHSSRAELELTYRLRRESWGRGLATESARAIVVVAFDALTTDRVFASTTAANNASRRVIEKLGMRPSAVTLPGDRESRRHPALPDAEEAASDGSGILEYELLRRQWEAMRRSPAPTARGLSA